MIRRFAYIVGVLMTLMAGNSATYAQEIGILDEVIAVVGEKVILKSDLDKTYYQMKLQYPAYDGDLKCTLFDQMLTQKLLLYKAEIDSIVIPDEQLELDINRRLEYFAAQAGGEKELEDYLGMSLVEYKALMIGKRRDEMLVERAQNEITGDLKVSPTEVREFFETIPTDSLPEFASEVEVAQLVMAPKPSAAAEKYARETAERLRAEIIKGSRNFCITASIYSDDEGSKKGCGELGDFKRGQMVPEFEAAVFRLKKDSISEVVKTQFGYHIIQLIERKGEIANARHILIRPKILQSDLEKTADSLLRIKNRIDNGTLAWCKAVNENSSDENAKANCGFYVDPNIGSQKIEITALESDVSLRVSKMDVGQISAPHAVQQVDGSTSFRLLYLKSEVPPHKASLQTDYQKLAVFALEKKKQDVLNEWSEDYRANVYVWIDDKYLICPGMPDWVTKQRN